MDTTPNPPADSALLPVFEPDAAELARLIRKGHTLATATALLAKQHAALIAATAAPHTQPTSESEAEEQPFHS